MKAIRVCDKNIEKITEALELVQKRTRERNINANDIMKAVEHLEGYFGIPKKHMVGLSVNCDRWANIYPNAYKYIPYSTQFVLEYRKSGWFVSDIRRDVTGRTGRIYIVNNMTDDTKDALVKRFTRF